MGIRKIGIIISIVFLSSMAYGQGIGNRGLGTPRLVVKEQSGAITSTPRTLVFPDDSLYKSGSSTHVHVLTKANADLIYLQTVTAPLTLPTITGESGKYITNNGSALSWGAIDLSAYLTTTTAATTYYKLDYSNDLTSTFLRINDASTASTDTLILADAIPAAISGANYNVLVGHLVAPAITGGDYNTIIGWNTANELTTGQFNTVLGARAGKYLCTSAQQNTYIGYQAGIGATTRTASKNTFVGSQAGTSITTGGENTCLGYYAGYYIASNASNTMIGSQAGYLMTGYGNTVVGAEAGGSGSQFLTCSEQTLLGYRAGYKVYGASSASNIILGYKAADNLTTGGLNIWIDYDSDTPAVDTSNYLRLGDYLIGDLNAGSTVGASLQITAGAATQIPLILKGAVAQSADYFDVKTSGGVIVTQLASTGAQTWNFGGDVVTNIAYSTPGGYPGIVGTYSSSALWALGGKSGQASWGRSGEYGFKHYTGGYMELGVAGETTSSLAQLLVSNSTGTTKTTLILRNQADQTGNAFTCQNSTPANGFQIEADFDIVAGSGAAGKDYTFTFDGETNDVTLTAMEDEKALKISDSLILDSIVADPGTLIDGQMWYRSDLDEFRGRVNGVTYKFVMQAI